MNELLEYAASQPELELTEIAVVINDNVEFWKVSEPLKQNIKTFDCSIIKNKTDENIETSIMNKYRKQ